MVKRMGSCRQCATCCRVIGFEVDTSNAPMMEWLDARGIVIVAGRYATLDHRCAQQNDDGTCKLHGENKPQICRDFPAEPDHLLPGCGFSFTEEE
jgi:hypothetical protein